MRKIALPCLGLAAVIALAVTTSAPAQDRDQALLAPATTVPATEPLSPQFQVSAGGKDTPVNLARVCSLSAEDRKSLGLIVASQTSFTSFASFDLAAPTQVTITCPAAVQSAVVRPFARGIKPTISGHTITFTVDKPGALVIDVNDDWIHSLQLFVNPPEQNVPHPGDPNVVYFGPGVHEIEHLELHSGQTLYLAPGAVLYGNPSGPDPQGAIVSVTGDNITVRGRGIIDGSLCPRGTRGTFYASGGSDRIEGIILRDSGGWTMPVRKCSSLLVDNVKIFGWRGNSDGIDICNSHSVEVRGCFIRTLDDLIVLKTDKGQGEESSVYVHGCVLWNEFAHALSLGAELREPLSSIRFSDCDIVHDKGREWALRVYNCDSAPVTNVGWDNIRIEECRRLMSAWIGSAIWSKEPERGHITHVAFRNITSVAPEVPDSIADLVGFDASHAITGVMFANVILAGNPLTRADVKQNAFVSGVIVTP